MSILLVIGLVIMAIVLFIGIIRVCFAPYTGFLNMLLEMMLLDYMAELLGQLISAIIDTLSGSDSDF